MELLAVRPMVPLKEVRPEMEVPLVTLDEERPVVRPARGSSM